MNHHRRALLTLISLFFVTFQSQALEHWFIPIEREMKTIQVVNLQNEAQMVWLSGPIKAYQDPMETSFEVPAFGKIEIPLNTYSHWSWAHLKAQTPGQMQIRVLTTFEAPFVIASGPSSRWMGRIRPNSTALLLNHSPYPQKVSVTVNQASQTLTIPGFGKSRVDLSSYPPASMLEVEGDSRISGIILAGRETKSMSPADLPRRLSPLAAPSRYFLVSNSFGTQSFVVEISNPELIEAATAQVQYPWLFLPRILIAKVQPGHSEMNRDFFDRRKTPWSWHVSRVIAFVELASQDCDGSPEMLEEILKPWIDADNNICFWNYKIKKEVSLSELRTGQLYEIGFGAAGY